MHKKAQEALLYIQVSSKDNVAIIVNDGGLSACATFSSGLTLTERIPQGHKVALKTFEQHDPIVRYGEIIGYVNETIIQGSWVKEQLIQMPAPPPSEELLSCITYSGSVPPS
ncbi:UxaA family hydrolase [Bacillus zhangzhouensis]|nr:UxaA family hydrolase [Bacillus zhangzhouensis]